MGNNDNQKLPSKLEAPDNHEYKLGVLTQRCSRCAWKDERLKKELTICPKCSSPVGRDCILKFGGTTIEFQSRKNRFFIDSGVIYEADFPDTIVFMLRHGNFWY